MDISEPEQKYFIPETYGTRPKFEEVINIPSDKKIILWRYTNIPKLVALLSRKQLHFSRSDVFKDKHEGSITEPMLKAQRKQFEGQPFNVEVLSNWRRNLKESTFISCWCIGTIESEAMWELYCGEKYGVAITSTYQDVESNIPNSQYIMAPVKYINYQTEGFPQNNYVYPFFHKRLAFAHEKEVRIVRVATDQYDDGSVPASFSNPPTNEQRIQIEEERKKKTRLKAERGNGINIDFNIINSIQDIVIHPDAPKWYYDVVKEIVEKFIPELNNRVKWSSIRGEPNF